MYRLKQLTLLCIDLLMLYFGFFIAILIRYGTLNLETSTVELFGHISFLLSVGVIIMFIAGLYDLTNNRNTFSFYLRLGISATLWALIGVVYFYLNTKAGVAPKTILLLTTIIGFGLLSVWRYVHNRFLSTRLWKYAVIFVGLTPEVKEIITTLQHEPERGFNILGIIEPGSAQTVFEKSIPHVNSLSELKKAISKNIDLIIIAPHLTQNEALLKELYRSIFDQTEVVELAEFYERITGRIPPFIFSESWFLTHLQEQQKKIYDRFRILIDYLCAILIGIFFILTFPFLALGIKLSASGPIFFRQTRVGRGGTLFTLIKYRSMKTLNPNGSAEISGPQFTAHNDPRITSFGAILRKIRLDELPQCINIFKGNMSIIGPRPERPEFVDPLTKKMPFYTLRHLVKPGLTGWASINESYYGTIDENLRKLEYDLYYVKNRGLLLDLTIILKTLSTMIGMKGR
jgi:exopolysaccharide biosynthesis polyprenyl glycosylphosphotransferase